MAKNVWLILLLSLGLSVVIAGCLGLADAQDGQPEEQPTIMAADNLRPAPTPSAGLEVAYLTIVVQSDQEGAVTEVGLEAAEVIASFAPNVLDHAGPWTVELIGERELRYGTLDPRRFEAEADEESGGEFESFIEENVVWELAVPLHDASGSDLGVNEIRVYDQEENVLIALALDGDAISQLR